MGRKREQISLGSHFEPLIGYSQAVKVGAQIFVSAMYSTSEDGAVMWTGDAYRQTKRVIEKIKEALERGGATLADVVRTRIYVTDITRWEEIGRAHRESFDNIRPATTLIEVASLPDPRMIVSIEAEALS